MSSFNDALKALEARVDAVLAKLEGDEEQIAAALAAAAAASAQAAAVIAEDAAEDAEQDAERAAGIEAIAAKIDAVLVPAEVDVVEESPSEVDGPVETPEA